MFPKRPARDEDEDDLLRQQEQFLRKNKITTVRNNPPVQLSPEKDRLKDNYDTVPFKCTIVEREVQVKNGQYSMAYVRQPEVAMNGEGFPLAQNISKTVVVVPTKKRSLYAQKFLSKNPVTTVDSEINNHSIVTGIGLGGENWRQEMLNIKSENKKLIENMGKEEIEEMRAELMKKLDPKIVEFLQSKKFKYRSEVSQEQVKENKMDVQISNPNLESVKDKIPIPLEEVKKYVHMDVVEPAKLSWMGDVGKNNETEKKTEDFSARFNFEGELVELDKSGEIDVHYGLHHHGEEPERPGYTINELFMYLQSSFPSQKQIGLKVFEKIIIKAYQGYYDACFNENLIGYLLKDTPLVLVVRKCLDETADSVWKCSIATLKAIVCNTVYDEIFLDRGYLILEDYLHCGFRINLNLKPVLDKEIEIDDEISDQQYSMYDIVSCLLDRTSLLQRFAYLIQNHLQQYDVPFIEEMFDILIRIARHSRQSAEKIIDSHELMDALFSNMIDRAILAQNVSLVHTKTFKLIRVCISSILATDPDTGTLPLQLKKLFSRFEKISFCQTLNFCLLLSPEDLASKDAKLMLKVSIESLRLWIKLLSIIFADYKHPFLESLQNNFFEIFSPLLKIVNYCKNLIPSEDETNAFDFQFASCVFMLFKMYHEILDKQNIYSKVYCFDLFDVCMRWFTIIQNQSIVPNFDANLCLLVLLEFILKHVQIDTKLTDIVIGKLLKNPTFIRKLFALCMKNSNTNFIKTSGTIRDSDNLPSFGSIYFRGFHSVPLFNNDSPILLLQSLLRVTLSVDGEALSTVDLSSTFHLLSEYINLVDSQVCKTFKPSIFDLIELNIVYQSCFLIQKVAQQNPSQPEDILKSVLKFSLMINVINSNKIKEDLIENVLFCPQLYRCFASEINFETVKFVYKAYSSFASDYWIFDPILSQVDNEKNLKIQAEHLQSCLLYIELIYEHFPGHFSKIEISKNSLFQLLASVFLVDENHFFNPEISSILERFLIKLFVSSNVECTASDTLPHFGNVIDL